MTSLASELRMPSFCECALIRGAVERDSFALPCVATKTENNSTNNRGGCVWAGVDRDGWMGR